MKIQLDTKSKSIKIEEKVNINEFFKIIKQMLPNDSWKEYSFETAVITNWYNPIYYQPYVTSPATYPWTTMEYFSNNPQFGFSGVNTIENTIAGDFGSVNEPQNIFNIEIR